ncbi:M1 family metallopeptidase [Stieleria varia]|nr:M1 family metallopeptidase [Stieleria varia]
MFLAATGTVATRANAQELPNAKHSDSKDKFFQIDSWLPTPGQTRTASGAPGPAYWQQRADYDMDITLDDENQRIEGKVRITYHNLSPHPLSYLWIQLDQNRFRPDSDQVLTEDAPDLRSRISFTDMKSILTRMVFNGGYTLKSVTDEKGGKLSYTVNKTMMRIDLPEPLAAEQTTTIVIDYSYNIVDAKVIRARGGYEFFEEDKNHIYEIAQFYPRVAAYTDYVGWQNKQFLGRGEFTLELGDYRVRLTVPEDMVVAATGTLQNAEQVMSPVWSQRLAKARTSDVPVYVITPEEAKENETRRGGGNKTWTFEASDVRDFAFAASRKFIWDAMGVDVDGRRVLAMSYFPREADPLWSQYSTEAIAHTLEVYGRYALSYPYPVAISVNGPVYGMEYPMICFNGPRPETDGTYSKNTKYALISVIIHEVGHNFFPMIVNSDERQWTWMDEGLNTFLQFLAEQEWEEDYPSRRGPPEKIVPYMVGGNQRPIMTGSEEILQFGNNGYSKPATALNILRETILGRELFDFAFREYAQRWKFKRPTPADFFRTMEDASGVDLDWFWRGWFYSTEHVDIGIESVRLYQIDSGDPDEKAERDRQERDRKEPDVSEERNKPIAKRIEWQPGLKDFYNNPEYDPYKVEEEDRKSFQKFLDGLSSDERSLLRRTTNFYVVDFRNVGGLVMPVIVRIHYSDNTNEMLRIPAEIWRRNSQRVSKLIVSDKEIVSLELDPKRETADSSESNNHWPPKLVPSRFKLFKDEKKKNEMQKANVEQTKDDSAGKEEADDKDAKKESAPPEQSGKTDDVEGESR